jgi:glycogen(starch) synthase
MLSWEYPPASVGGLARHVSYLSREVARCGHEVDLVTQGTDGLVGVEETPIGDGVLRVRRRQPYALSAPDFIHWVHLLNYGFLEGVLNLVSQQSRTFDVIHAHDWLVAFAARACKHACRAPLVATIHATEAGRHSGIHNPGQRYISEVEWWLTYEAWRVICCSEYMKTEMAGQFLLPTDKIRVIPNGIDPVDVEVGQAASETTAPASSAERPTSASSAERPGREAYAAPGEDIVCYVGRLVREKGVDTFLEAVPAILDRRPATRFVICGAGPYGDSLREHAGQMGLGDLVRFTGYLDDHDRNRLYRWASVAVVPSYYEPFGLTALEAMAAGAPVVVSDTGGLGETVVHGETGLKVPPADPGALAAGILRLLGDREMAGRLTAAAKTEIAERFSWRKVAAMTGDVYSEVVQAARESGWTAENGTRVGEDWGEARLGMRAMTRGLDPIGRYNPPS